VPPHVSIVIWPWIRLLCLNLVAMVDGLHWVRHLTGCDQSFKPWPGPKPEAAHLRYPWITCAKYIKMSKSAVPNSMHFVTIADLILHVAQDIMTS